MVRFSSWLAAFVLMIFVASSCSRSDKGWGVSGEISGEGDYSLALEGFNNGNWYVIDSLKTKKGRFSYNADAPASFPEILRLGLAGNYIYFPIDSVDHIKIYADADNFAGDYSLEGSLQARTVKSLDSLINVSVRERGVENTVHDASLKRRLFEIAFDDSSVMPVYYLINKSVGSIPLYNVNDAADRRFFGAVAQRFAVSHPSDTRGAVIAEMFKNARPSHGGASTVLEVPETGLIDIVREDSKGNKCSLAEMASKGNVVLLNFTAYGMEASPAYNIVLNSLYEKYHDAGFDIYQIAFDDDESTWKQTARNLPWTAVWNSTTDGNRVLANYNVAAIPVSFIIDRSGSLVERVEDPSQLEKEIKKYM